MENFHLGSPLIARHFLKHDLTAANHLPTQVSRILITYIGYRLIQISRLTAQITLIGDENGSTIIWDLPTSNIPIGLGSPEVEAALHAAGIEYEQKVDSFVRRIMGYAS